jgi:hypothetical protein
MPEKKLAAAAIADLSEWIKRGAPWPAEAKTTSNLRSGPITKEERQFWSLQLPKESPLPEVKDASRVNTPIDRFITAAGKMACSIDTPDKAFAPTFVSPACRGA